MTEYELFAEMRELRGELRGTSSSVICLGELGGLMEMSIMRLEMCRFGGCGICLNE